ncbi:MAG: hypothetical protein Q4G10_02760 [Bacteroidia bacterium]|nr:hypothetical protein [Bacteroidia bacterium]
MIYDKTGVDLCSVISDATGHTRHSEMKELIKFVFNVTDIKFQSVDDWSLTSGKHKTRLKEWVKRLDEPGGVIFWEMHGFNIFNKHYGTDYTYHHRSLLDLHWVPVWKVERKVVDDEDRVWATFHSWGKCYNDNYSLERLHKVTYDAFMVTIK